MLEKLALNKKLYLILFYFIFSCAQKKPITFTEMLCTKERFLIRFASAEEVVNAIENAIIEKKKYNSSENYTVIKMSGNRSFKIANLSPEEAIKCKVHDFPTNLRYKYYEKYYK